MSSEFPGGYPYFFNLNNNMNPYRSPLAGLLSGNGKRSLAEFQQQQQLQHAARVYLRNVKAKSHNQYSISMEKCLPEYSGTVIGNQCNSYNQIDRVRVCENELAVNLEKESMIRNQLQKLEKELLLDDDEDLENDVVSVVTDCEISETIQNLLSPVKTEDGVVSVVNHSPTTSFSSCASSSATAVCSKELISAAATAIMDEKTDAAVEILSRLNQISNARGTPDQRLSFYMTSALRKLVSYAPGSKQSSPVSELYCKEHVLSTQLLYDKSPCFKLAFMAANNTILEAVSGSGQPDKKLHILDFDIGQGVQYVYLLHEIAAARESARDNGKLNHISLKLTTFADFGNGGFERLKLVGDGLKLLSSKLSVSFSFNVLKFNLSNIRNDVVSVNSVNESEVFVVNFAFKLYRLPDESVTVDNLRDEVLRKVKSLSPCLVTVVEQELNANTASFSTRVNEVAAYYKALFESLELTFQSDNSDRVRIEEGLSRRIANSVACEGRDRVERCEVFGKWQARMRMAGFKPKPLCQLSVELLLSKLNSGTRVNREFTVKEYSDGISFGWMGRNLTVASAWH